MKIKDFWAVFCLVFMFSCHSNPQKQTIKQPDEPSMMNVNRFLVEKDEELVKNYINRHGWKTEKNPAGFWIEIVKRGKGPVLQNGKQVTVDYKESLLDGTVCYSSAGGKFKTFKLGYGEWTRGIDEGLKNRHVGDSIRLIVLPSMAYGVPGNGDKIPARSVVVYELTIKSQQNKPYH